MMIEGRRFLELALHVKLASEAMIAAARSLASLKPSDDSPAHAQAWTRAIDELMAMNIEIGGMERILRSLTSRGTERRRSLPQA